MNDLRSDIADLERDLRGIQAEFAEKIAGFKSRLSELNAKGAELDREIARNLDRLSFAGQEGA